MDEAKLAELTKAHVCAVVACDACKNFYRKGTLWRRAEAAQTKLGAATKEHLAQEVAAGRLSDEDAANVIAAMDSVQK